MIRYWPILVVVILLSACSIRPSQRLASADTEVDYSLAKNWAALPQISDPADSVPDPRFIDRQSEAQVDVFFLHPTTYTGDRGQRYWNAPIDDPEVNAKTDRTTILHQASIFNGAGRIYAPRYRQAHIYAYFDKKHETQVARAFERAYQDIRNAFMYYLEHYHHDQPIIIAAHSQGTTHAKRLLKEFFDGEALQKHLVAAYLVGIPVAKDEFQSIKPCQLAEDIGCYCSWRTFREGYKPKSRIFGDSIAVTNPLTWTTDSQPAPASLNKGGVLRNYGNGIHPALTDAQVHKGMLWASRPNFPGSFLMLMKNYHIGDYNLYWVNVRENAQARAQQFIDLQEQSASTP